MRSKNRPVSSMMRNTAASVRGTAAATTMPTRQPRLDEAHQQHHAERHRELHHEFVDRRGDVDGLIGHLVERHPERQRLCDGRGPVLKRLAERETVPALLHNRREHDGGLALVADEVGGRILIAAANLGDVGELQRPPRSHDRRVGDRLDTVISAVDPDEDLRAPSVDRACRRDGVLPLQGGNNSLCRHAEGRQFGIGELDEYLFGTFTEDVDLLDAGHVQEVLADHLGLPNQLTHRHALGLERIKGEAHVRIFVVDEGAEARRTAGCGLHPRASCGLGRTPPARQMAACCPSARPSYTRNLAAWSSRPGRTRSVPEVRFSNGSATRSCISRAVAPGHTVVTVSA